MSDKALPCDEDLVFVAASAVLVAGEKAPVGTDSLLVGLATVGGVTAALDAVEMTKTVARTVSRRCQNSWTSLDAAGSGSAEPVDIMMVEDGSPAQFTAGAAEALYKGVANALTAGRSRCSPADLLIALLEDPANRATELMNRSAIDIAELRASLIEGRQPVVADRVAPELRRIRDVLLGRSHYERHGWRNWLQSFILRGSLKYADHPLLWVRLEANEQAAVHSRTTPGTDDLILAILATYEVAMRYRHLYDPATDEFHGAQLLAQAGARFSITSRVVRITDLGDDPKPARSFMPDDGEPSPNITSLLKNLLIEPPNRASRLLAAMNVDTSAILR